MPVESKRCLDFKAPHDGEGDTVCQRITLVAIALKQPPTFLKHRRLDMNEMHQRAAHQIAAYFDSLGMMPVAIKESSDFIEHVCGAYERRG